MTIEFNFSCEETRIDISKVKQAGYVFEIQKCAPNNTDNDYYKLIVTNSNGVFNYIASNMCLTTNQVIVPAQTNAYFHSETHPMHDMGVFANLQGLAITNISVGDKNSPSHECVADDEESFVLSLMLEEIEDCLPFTQEWVKFYNKYSPVSKQVMRDSREMNENTMRSLIIMDTMSKALENV